jgi:CO/xanthine dehydrogenase Mo-binding subunit
MMAGVKAILTGDSYPDLTGSVLEDRPPLAKGKVRYYGEPVALVIARSEFEACAAAARIKIEYEKLPTVNSPREAIKSESLWFMINWALIKK